MRSVFQGDRRGGYFPTLAPRMARPLSHLSRPKQQERPMALQDIEPNTKPPIHRFGSGHRIRSRPRRDSRPFLRAFAVSLSGNWNVADDLAQETLTKAWRSRRSFHPRLESRSLFSSPSFATNTARSSGALGAKPTRWAPRGPKTRPAVPDQQDWAVELSDTASAMEALPDERNAKPCSWLERPAFPMKRPRSIRGWPWEQ